MYLSGDLKAVKIAKEYKCSPALSLYILSNELSRLSAPVSPRLTEPSGTVYLPVCEQFLPCGTAYHFRLTTPCHLVREIKTSRAALIICVASRARHARVSKENDQRDTINES